MKTPYLDNYIKSLEADRDNEIISFYQHCKLRELIEIKKQLNLHVVVKSLKIKDLMTFEDYKNNLFIKVDGVYQPKKTKLFLWYSEKQLKKMYKDKPL
jgi:hypothetical protein